MSCGIYKITNNLNGKAYIGQAVDIEARWNKHRNAKDNFAIHQAFRKYGIENFPFEILEECPRSDLDEKEVFWIHRFNTLENGYNMIEGGSNGAGLAKGKQVEQYSLSGAKLNTYPSAAEAARITGVDHTTICSCCRNESRTAGGFQWKYEGDNREIRSIQITNKQRPICQYDLQGILLHTYDSLNEAHEITGINKPGISNVCSGKSHTAGGYRWSYLGDELIIRDKNKQPKLKKRVAQYSSDNKLIRVFNSLTEASESTGINLGNIGQVCIGNRKTAGGFIWKYIEEM